MKAQSPEKAAAAVEGLARLNEERGEMMSATALRRAVIGLRPEDPQPHEKLAQMLLDALSAEGAEPDQTSREDAQNEFDEAARLYEAHGQTDCAVACLRKLLDLTRQIDVARALLVRERLAALQPGDIALRHDLVEAYLKSGRSVRALGEARALTDYLIESAQLEEAAKSLRVVVRLDPWNQTEKARLGSVLAILGQTEEARRLLGAVLAREPEDQTALLALEKIDRAAREAADDSSANSEEKSNVIATQPSEIDGASEGQRITDRPGVRDVTNLAEGSILDDPTVVNIDLIDQENNQAIDDNMIVEASSAMGGTAGGQTKETEANEAWPV